MKQNTDAGAIIATLEETRDEIVTITMQSDGKSADLDVENGGWDKTTSSWIVQAESNGTHYRLYEEGGSVKITLNGNPHDAMGNITQICEK